MQLKYLQTILEGQNSEYPIAALAWSPNNKKLAVATCERTIYLFDDAGTKRDKFSTKPSDPSAGRKSYTISCLAFSNESDTLAVGQSDNIVFVYRLGNTWDTKKVICNKFQLNSSCTCLYWISSTTMMIGQLDGKIRYLECKTNKASSSWSGSSACVSLSGFNGSFVVSGHFDGALLTSGSRLLARHPVSPNALCVLENAVLAAGCDKRIIIYDYTGRVISSFDLSKNLNQREFTVACASASGQAAIVGSYNACHIIEWSPNQGKWISGLFINITGLYSARAVAWSNDGSKITIGGFTGATLIYEAMMKRWMCGKTVEAIRRGQGQMMLKKLGSDVPPLTVQSFYGRSINTVKVMADDWYVVCRTENSLIICDLARSLISEVEWSGSGERFFFQHAPVCLIYLAGELTLIEYGVNSILTSVRTEFINPHLISVRINEDNATTIDNKKLAYLLDQKSVCVIDLVTGIQIAQARVSARVDWLELSESSHILLLRDRRRRLSLLNISTGKLEVILSGVNFVQWVEGSDAVVAQTSTHVAIWYSINDISSVELMECGSGHATKIEFFNDVPRVVLQNGSIPYINLDHARLKFCAALKTSDFKGCELYLSSLDDFFQTNSLWEQLASKAMELEDLNMAIRCQMSLGDEAKAAYLSKTLSLSEAYEKEHHENGMKSPLVRARLAIYSYDLSTAEKIYIEELNEPSKAISMYTSLHRWPEALAVADRLGLPQATNLKDQYMKYLISSGSEGEAAMLLAARGDPKAALQLVLQADLPSRAARLLKEFPILLNNRDCYTSVLQALLRSEWWEHAAELCENAGDTEQAVELYAKANFYAKAVQKARQVAPHQVTFLEHKWGEWLVERRQWGAAVAHLIEAGDSRGALAAAVRAQQWAKALQIIQVIDDTDSVQEYYEILANHFAEIQEWNTAEALWEAGGLMEEGARVLGDAGQWIRALAFARRTLGNTVATNIFQPEADRLKDSGSFKEAENLYVGLGLTDSAISMYEAVGRHKSLLRLVSKHRPQLLGAARRRVAQSLRDEGRLKQAEQYYIEADDWKGAIQMYRNLNQWEDAYRISQQYAPPQIQEQVLVAWSNSIEDDATAARVLINYGALEAGVRWAARGGRWLRALALCNIGAPQMEIAVRAQMASHLEDEGKLEEAEVEFVKGGSASEAISMWLHAQQYSRALSLAEQYVPEKEAEVLQAYAEWAEAQGDLPLYEALIIRAGRPQDVIKYYKENLMWEDAIRVCEEYLPQGARALREEAIRAGAKTSHSNMSFNDLNDIDPENILRTAVEYTNNGEYWEAVQSLLSITVQSAGAGTVERAALRAARMVRDQLSPNQAKQIAPLIAQRLTEAGQESMGTRIQEALLNMSVENDNNAEINTFEDSTKAEQLARRGEWSLALEVASALGSSATARLAIRWATVLLQQPDTFDYQNKDEMSAGGVIAALNVLSKWGCVGPGSLTLIPSLLARSSALPAPPFTIFRDLRNIIHSMILGNEVENDNLRTFERMLEASALICVREACRYTPPLKPLALKAATALLRHTDIIAADNAFYEAGCLMKEAGRESEALIFLNRYLDLAEAADADLGENAPIDHSDFGDTDFPQEVVLGGSAITNQQHDEIREWVLAVSLDQNISQTLSLDKRHLYESCLGPGEAACILTGFPLTTRVVHFTSGKAANREAWAKLHLHCTTEPASDPADCKRFLTTWCGADDYSLS